MRSYILADGELNSNLEVIFNDEDGRITIFDRTRGMDIHLSAPQAHAIATLADPHYEHEHPEIFTDGEVEPEEPGIDHEEGPQG